MAPPGRRRAGLSPAALLLGFVFLFSSTASAASAVIGVDIGTEYIKAALVKPGIPLEIVLTKDARRKEISAVAFKPLKSGPLPAASFPERFYGSDAIALQGRFPGDVYPNLKHLLGVNNNSHVVSVYKQRYPSLELATTKGRKTVSFKSGVFAAEEDKVYSVEELLAMELKSVRENAKAMAGKGYDVQDAVYTIPPFYTVEERRALEVASRLAGLNVLSMVSDGVAVGLNYAMTRTFPDITKDGNKPEVNLVFDMGAGSTTATLLKFQGRSVKDVGKRNKTIQEVQVLGTGWDRTLGGDALNTLIVDDMVSTFVELPGAKSASITAEKVKAHGRTAAKLFKEAERVRQVISANTETAAFFESFFEDVDFRYKLSRSRLEELSAAYATRIDGPVSQALQAAGLAFADVDSIIVHGGATRTPFIQSRLEALAGKGKIRANVNADEAAVFGAAFKAASLSPSFRVKEIRDSDTQGYSHGIQYSFNLKERDQRIFTPGTKLGATKDLPFQMMGEFEFTLYQAVPGAKNDAPKEPTLHFKSGNLTKVVTKMIDDNKCDRDSFNNYVKVRLSPTTGIPEILSAWVTCEGDGTKSGIVDGMKNLFGMGGKKEQDPLKESEDSSSSVSAATKSASSSASSSSSSLPSSKSSKKAKSADAAKADEKQVKIVRSAITFEVTELGYEKHPRTELKRMQDRLMAFDASDKARRVREEVLNSLEAFTYRGRDYLEDESFIGASTSAVRTSLESALSATSDWIYSEGAEATEKVLRGKLKELEDIVNPVLKRKNEAAKRPDAIKELKDTIAHIKEVETLVVEQIKNQSVESAKSSEAVSRASASLSASPSADPLADLEGEDATTSTPAEPEITEVPTVYSESDLESVQAMASQAQKWLEDAEAKQSQLRATDDPAYTVKEILAEKKKLDDMVMDMMMKKMRAFRPPVQKAKAKTKAKPAKKKTDKKSKSDRTSDEEKVAAEKQPTEEEAQEALKQAGINDEDAKNSGGKHDSDSNLKQPNSNQDVSEEETRAAPDDLADGSGEKHDEL